MLFTFVGLRGCSPEVGCIFHVVVLFNVAYCVSSVPSVTMKTSLRKRELGAFLFGVLLYSRLSLSRIPRDSLKHFEIFVPRQIRVERVRKTIDRAITFNK